MKRRGRKTLKVTEQDHLAVAVLACMMAWANLTFSVILVPVPKKSLSCLNDHHPTALTPILMKCFKKLVVQHIRDNIPSSLGPHQ